ncbi:MAG: Mfa1 fimbrilin C-terminal domain-containing protein, partial [Duncaniella sp.]|nr:Mfa1 fimbrilin C-terminal domain-containing protein [Duncaniella sp.]
VGLIKEAVLQISIAKGDPYPAYVVCFLNPVDFTPVDKMKGAMETLRDLRRGDYANGNKNFTMSNSVYFGSDPLTGATNVKMSGAPISASQLYTTKEAAEAGTASAVDIYVERYAAKVNFNLAVGAIKDYTYGGYTLTFNPEFWTINADAPSMFAIKRYADSDAETTGIPTMAAVDEMLEGWNSWNDPANFRSYWACSPGFYATQFPRVSDDIIDNMTPGVTGAGYPIFNSEAEGYVQAGTRTGFALRYYSYNQVAGVVTGSFGKGVPAVAGTQATKYTLENTMGKAAFESLNPKAAAPSAILVGNYTVKKGDAELSFPDGFCLFEDGVYAAGATAPAEDEKTILDRMLDKNSILWTNIAGEYVRINSGNCPEGLKSLFTVKHPNKEVRGTQAVPHRYVTLQIVDGTTNFTGLYYKPDGAADFIPVEVSAGQTAEQLVTNINTLLWQQIGNASQYTNGKCYFSIPIRHLGYTESEDGAPETDGSLDWTKVRVGDFGLVRNHVYTINVTSIEGRADGIQGLNNPLVPSMDENNYYVKYRINILNWRVVPTQNVVL